MGKYIIILATPRTGSSFLNSLMKAYQIANCSEHQLNYNTTQYTKELLLDLRDKYIRRKNYPYYGMKILPHIFSKIDDCFGNIFNFLEASKADVHFIYLYRHDFIQQIISYYMALETDYWIGKFEDKYYQKFSSLKFNIGKVNLLEKDLKNDIDNYLLFFNKFNISPCSISYEELTKDSYAIIEKICNSFNITIDKTIKPENLFEKQQYPSEIYENLILQYRNYKSL